MSCRCKTQYMYCSSSAYLATEMIPGYSRAMASRKYPKYRWRSKDKDVIWMEKEGVWKYCSQGSAILNDARFEIGAFMLRYRIIRG